DLDGEPRRREELRSLAVGAPLLAEVEALADDALDRKAHEGLDPAEHLTPQALRRGGPENVQRGLDREPEAQEELDVALGVSPRQRQRQAVLRTLGEDLALLVLAT